MPRDPTITRDALIDAGRELFAERGVFSVPLSSIVARAEQRNASALHYHFGGRQGLLAAIIDVHNAAIEQRRRMQLDGLGDGSLGEFVAAYIDPQVALFESASGRQFLNIVGQLQDLFDRWDEPMTPTQASRAMHAIASHLDTDLSPSIRHERVTRFLGLVAEALGSRARAIERGRTPSLGQDQFVANLRVMCVGALRAAPVSGRE